MKAIKQVDVVISTVGTEQLADQRNIISAIKEAGNIKVYLSKFKLFIIFKVVSKIWVPPYEYANIGAYW